MSNPDESLEIEGAAEKCGKKRPQSSKKKSKRTPNLRSSGFQGATAFENCSVAELRTTINIRLPEMMHLLEIYRKTADVGHDNNLGGYAINFVGTNVLIKRTKSSIQKKSYTKDDAESSESSSINQIFTFGSSDDGSVTEFEGFNLSDRQKYRQHYSSHESVDADGPAGDQSDDNVDLPEEISRFPCPSHSILRTRVAISMLEEFVDAKLREKAHVLSMKDDPINLLTIDGTSDANQKKPEWDHNWITVVDECHSAQRALGCMYNGRLLYPWLYILKEVAEEAMQHFVSCSDKFQNLFSFIDKVITLIPSLINHLDSTNRHSLQISKAVPYFSGTIGSAMEDLNMDTETEDQPE